MATAQCQQLSSNCIINWTYFCSLCKVKKQKKNYICQSINAWFSLDKILWEISFSPSLSLFCLTTQSLPNTKTKKSQMAIFKMKIYYIDAIVIPLSAVQLKIKIEMKKKILEKICSNINLKTVHVLFSSVLCDPFFYLSLASIFEVGFSVSHFKWNRNSYKRVKLTNFVSCIKFIAAASKSKEENKIHKFNITNESKPRGHLIFY